jgi:catechol 2,3-dioxygenase-like lactoylglutathione lyase family enzyme
MSGIIFFRTTDRDEIVAFYRDRLDFEIWVEQEGCTIVRHDNLLLGFCDGDETETDGVVTLFFENRQAVDARYEALSDIAREPPTYNEAYDIYQFFAEDPDGRTLEFQTFEHDLPAY